jgi:hypothetical protein
MIEMNLKEIFSIYIIFMFFLYLFRLLFIVIEDSTSIIKEVIIFLILSSVSITASINNINNTNIRYQNRLNSYNTYIK